MSPRVPGRQTVEAAMLVALMLVVQAFFSGLSLGANAAPLQRDAFGQVICTTDGGRLAASEQPGAPAHHPADCCTLGCSMVGAALPDPFATPRCHPDPVRRLGAALASSEAPSSPILRLPQNPRAPPSLS